MRPPLLALTQGDPAGIGPEILLRLIARPVEQPPWRPLILAERAALECLADVLPEVPWERLDFVHEVPLASPPDRIPVLDPVASRRQVHPGCPSPEDARGAMAALDLGIDLARRGQVDALVTAPLNKAEIARHLLPDFRGHTEYLAASCDIERYGRDYLMTFLGPSLRVALLSTHLPLRRALDHISPDTILEALRCLARHVDGRIAVAGFNPHAGEAGLLGMEDGELVAPAVAAARRQGIDAHGPESADSLFARQSRGEFDWVLALYHDQGLIAVKTACFGQATNWTLGLPFLRTSVDHGTAYDLAGRGAADAGPLRAVVETTLQLLRRTPRHKR